MEITSPFGGLIYLIGKGGSSQSLNVKLENVVEAPFFDLESPSPKWNPNAPAPFGEIKGRYLV